MAGVLWAGEVGAQATTGMVSGRVVDSTSQQPLSNVTVAIPGTPRGTLTRSDGTFSLSGVPAGTVLVRAVRIGYAAQTQSVDVPRGGTATVTFALGARAASLSEVVVTGYGTQRREAITGSVATVKADEARVGVVTNANTMLTARVAGVNVVSNNGEPGAGVQIRIRGGTSLSASNDPLYIIDGVPLQSENPVASGVGIGSAPLSRSGLNAVSPDDIASITVLKDAAATAIYGSRAANGVVLIETKKGRAGSSQISYDGYVGASQAARTVDFLTGNQYRDFVEQQIKAGNIDATARQNIGSANTNWQDAVLRTGVAQNHNLAFSGGSTATQYRASLNYFQQQGVVIGDGLTRYQGRVNATNESFGGKLQTGLNLTAARVNNVYAPFDNTAGFSGGLFTNVAVFNPTQPILDPKTGAYYEIGSGAQSVRNPVALVHQIVDRAPEDRVIGNVNASLALLPSVTAKTLVGVDYASSVRQAYFPLASPVGAETNGRASQKDRALQTVNFQQLLTFNPRFAGEQEFELLGGYEFTQNQTRGFEAEMRGFLTDAFQFNNLGAGTQNGSPLPISYLTESRLVSFFSRANYSFHNRYFLSGVVRYDGSSRLAEGNKWSVFPAISGSWRLSEEEFVKGGPFSNLTLRAGWGRQGNQAVRPYGTQLLLRTNTSALYPFGNQVITGFAASQVANPNLKWETDQQTNVALDYGLADDRFTGTIEVYQKDTKDLLLDVPVPQPAVVSTQLANVGSLQNRGLEATFDAQLVRGTARTFTAGLVFTMERNKVKELGAGREFIITSSVQGQGQSGRFAQRLIPGQPIGTFWGPEFVGFNGKNQQLFACARTAADCVNGSTTAPTGDDERIIGDANPAFSLGLRSNGTWNGFDASWLWRAEVGRDVFNNTALIYSTTANAKQGRNFMASALSQQDAFGEPAIYSSRWIEDGSFFRLQNVTIGYRLNLPSRFGGGAGRQTRVFVSGDNLLLFTPYSGADPETFVRAGDGVTGSTSRGIDYLVYPRARTFTTGVNIQF